MELLDQDMDELERLLPSCGVSAHGGISGVQTVSGCFNKHGQLATVTEQDDRRRKL
jgi:hypothetical protein